MKQLNTFNSMYGQGPLTSRLLEMIVSIVRVLFLQKAFMSLQARIDKAVRFLFVLSVVCATSIQAQTPLIDLYPGTASSSPNFLAQGDSNFIFTAYSPEYGNELWISDGTLSGTRMLKDITPGGYNSSITIAIYVKGYGYLFNNTNGNNHELWGTNGSETGTIKLIEDIDEFKFPYPNRGQVVCYKGKIYFRGQDTLGGELWESDGTKEGTKFFKELNPGKNGTYIGGLSVINDRLMFGAITDSLGGELWISDGTIQGTNLLKDVYPGPKSGNRTELANSFISMNGLYYFSGIENDSIGNELYVSDGTPEGTKLFYNFGTHPQYPNGRPQFVPLNDTSFVLMAMSSKQVFWIWKTNGTVAGTKAIEYKDHSVRECYVFNAYALNDKLVYRIYEDKSGHELWVESPDFSNVNLLFDLLPGQNSGCCQHLPVIIDKYAYFITGNIQGDYLWRTNGEFDHTKVIYNFVPEVNVTKLIAINNKLFAFGNLDVKYGYEIYEMDITSSIETKRTKDPVAFPNPIRVGSVLTISDTDAPLGIRLFDLNGREIHRVEGQQTLDIPFNLSAGIYLVKIIGNNATRHLRLIVE